MMAEPAGLSGREETVRVCLEEGMRNKQIANALGITEDTVKKHLRKIYRLRPDLQRRRFAVRAERGWRTCSHCEVSKPAEDFEGTRKTCTPCRNKNRAWVAARKRERETQRIKTLDGLNPWPLWRALGLPEAS